MEDLRINTQEYNGWKNRETWAAMLYINNDQGLQDQATELTEREFNRATGETRADKRSAGITLAASRLEIWIEQLFTRAGYVSEFGGDWPASLADMAADIGSLYRVDYREITEGLLEDKLAAFDEESAA